jgi:hypothetical protein
MKRSFWAANLYYRNDLALQSREATVLVVHAEQTVVSRPVDGSSPFQGSQIYQ